MEGTVRYVDTSDLPVNENSTRAPLYWGMVMLIIIELVFFLALIVAYFYIRFFSPEWPVGGISQPSLTLPIIYTVLLLASSVPVYWADHAIRRGEVGKLFIGMGLAFLLAAGFLVLKGIEYAGLEYTWATNVYGSLTWTISGFHAAHVLSVMAKVAVVMIAAANGYFGERRNLGVRINGLYWHFVVAIWLPLFFTLYLSHYVL